MSKKVEKKYCQNCKWNDNNWSLFCGAIEKYTGLPMRDKNYQRYYKHELMDKGKCEHYKKKWYKFLL